jgi:hypothetical protein
MNLPIHDPDGIKKFFEAIAPIRGGYSQIDFRFVAIKQGDRFCIIRSSLIFNTGATAVSSHFTSEHIHSGVYPLADLKTTPEKFVEQVLSGKISVPSGDIHFQPPESGDYCISFNPLHPAGLQGQNRFNTVNVLGAKVDLLVRQPLLDWALRASPTPYDNLQELLLDFGLGVLTGNSAVFEITALNVAVVDFGSEVKGEKAVPRVKLAKNLSVDNLAMNYRVLSQGKVISRAHLSGSNFKWNEEDGLRTGLAEISIPSGAVLSCYVSYAGVVQNFGWLHDPATSQNPRNAIHMGFDPQHNILKELLEKHGRGQNAREFETGVAWLAWLLGFCPVQLGGTSKTQQDAADLILATPNGNFVVVECTTGLLKAENKLALLVERSERVRTQLTASNFGHLRILTVIVTSKPRNEVKADLDQAEKLGILVLTRENLKLALNQIVLLPRADQLFEEAEQAVQADLDKYRSQPL